MRVLGVDPGLTRCGLGVVESGPGRSLTLVHVEVVGTPTGTPLAERIARVHAGVVEVIARTRPDAVAVEQVFSQVNLRTVMGTAQASGVAILAGAQAGLPVVLHTPTEVKAAVTGSGRAGKAQVAAMVRRLLGLAEAPSPADAADSLALAICHLWRPRIEALASRSGPGAAGPDGPTPAQQQWARAEAAARSATRR